MPRKTDGMIFELHKRPTTGSDGKPLLYARPESGMKKKTDDLDRFCTLYRGLRPGEMSRLFDCFMEVAAQWLAEGYRIETPVGSFAPRLRLNGDFTDPNDVHGRDVSFAGIDFLPSKRFVEAIGENLCGFRKSPRRMGTAQMQDVEAMERALRQSLHNGYITVRNFQKHSGLSNKSANRYLHRLCEGEHPRLRKEKEGNTLHFFPND
ncbi:MAG: hypothetical protein J5506_00660 [Prevotella sp.]|nr:hypothetical protein [Prevotella sp.]